MNDHGGIEPIGLSTSLDRRTLGIGPVVTRLFERGRLGGVRAVAHVP